MNTVNRVSVSIRLSLFLMIVAINTALVGGLIYYNHLQNTKIAIAAAYDMMAKTGETVQKRSQLLIRPPADFTRFMPAWTAIDQKPTASGHPAKAEMLTAVKGFDHNASSYIGYDDGSFYQLYKSFESTLRQCLIEYFF